MALLAVSGLEKSFPGVKALKDGRLTLEPGEIHALLGENGAGKSTLLKVLSGAHQADAGQIKVDDTPVTIAAPPDAAALGIAIIYQEFNLVPQLTVSENLFLGRELGKGAFVDRKSVV